MTDRRQVLQEAERALEPFGRYAGWIGDGQTGMEVPVGDLRKAARVLALIRASLAEGEPVPAERSGEWQTAIETVRHGISEAMVLGDIAGHKGDSPPFSSGYDDVHDAYNAIWAASRAIETIALLSLKGEDQ